MKELAHYTESAVREYLTRSLAIVDEANVPDDLRETAFGKVFDAVSAKTIIPDEADVRSPVARILGVERLG